MLSINADPRDIARAYDRAAQDFLPEVQRAYWALERYVNLRYQDALDDGWRFIPTEHGEAPFDLTLALQTRVLDVRNTDHDHPAWSDETNYRFRAVHDIYGHIPQGDAAPFTYAGEVVAAQQQARDIIRAEHRLTYTHQWNANDRTIRDEILQAIRAMLTEVIGQAAYFEVHGRFPVQKATLIFSELPS